MRTMEKNPRLERQKSQGMFNRRESIRENDLIKKDDQTQKMLAREFLAFFSPVKIKKITSSAKSRE